MGTTQAREREGSSCAGMDVMAHCSGVKPRSCGPGNSSGGRVKMTKAQKRQRQSKRLEEAMLAQYGLDRHGEHAASASGGFGERASSSERRSWDGLGLGRNVAGSGRGGGNGGNSGGGGGGGGGSGGGHRRQRSLPESMMLSTRTRVGRNGPTKEAVRWRPKNGSVFEPPRQAGANLESGSGSGGEGGGGGGGIRHNLLLGKQRSKR